MNVVKAHIPFADFYNQRKEELGQVQRHLLSRPSFPGKRCNIKYFHFIYNKGITDKI